jgi:hypothetical protein
LFLGDGGLWVANLEADYNRATFLRHPAPHSPERQAITGDIFIEIHSGVPGEDRGRNDDTAKASPMLPKSEQPCIPDIGCGSG